MEIKQHALSAAFPGMQAEDFDALVADIVANGLRQPVLLFEGQVLDGWHRYSACIKAGVEPSFKEVEANEDPVALVLSLNLQRRHLTASQRAMAVVSCSEWLPRGRPGKGALVQVFDKPTVSRMAEKAAVSERTIQQAKVAHSAGLASDVVDGALSVRAAAAQATQAAVKAEEAHKEPEIDASDELRSELEGEIAAAVQLLESDDKVREAWNLYSTEKRNNESMRLAYEAQRQQLAEAMKSGAYWRKKYEKLAKEVGRE